jgi:allophanate hydrolase
MRVTAGAGTAIPLEVWEMPVKEYDSLAASIPAPLRIGTIELENGSLVQGFLCESTDPTGTANTAHSRS